MMAVAVGGVLGCLMRWFLALVLNRYFPAIPPGTLAANLIGCYIIGIAIAVFCGEPAIPLEWRLFRHDGILRRPDHVLHLLGRDRDAHADRPDGLGHGCDRHAFDRLVADDIRRHRDDHVG